MVNFPQRTWLVLIIIMQTMISTCGGVGAAYYYYYHNEKIIPGVEVSGIAVQGLSRTSARQVLDEKLPLPSNLTLQWEEMQFEIPLHTGTISYNLDEVLDIIFSSSQFKGRGGFFNVISWFPDRIGFNAPLGISSLYLQDKLGGLREYIDVEPEDASLIIEEGIPLIMKERQGYKLDIQESKKNILEHLARGETSFIPLHVTIVPAEISEKDLPNFQGRISSFTTFPEIENRDRNHNIMLAGEALNGFIIEPGQIFSFNEIVGPFTAEKGYREVLVIQNRKFVPGIGGGVCQVATTLYMAALLAEMDVVQRSCHSRPVSYVSLGQDATVAYGLLDLKLKNNRDFPLIFMVDMDESLNISIFGEEEIFGRKVEISSEEVEIIHPRILENPDPNLPKGIRQQVQKGEEGYRVKVYRLVYEDSFLKSKELISSDEYLPVNEVVHIGTMEVMGAKK